MTFVDMTVIFLSLAIVNVPNSAIIYDALNVTLQH